MNIYILMYLTEDHESKIHGVTFDKDIATAWFTKGWGYWWIEQVPLYRSVEDIV